MNLRQAIDPECNICKVKVGVRVYDEVPGWYIKGTIVRLGYDDPRRDNGHVEVVGVIWDNEPNKVYEFTRSTWDIIKLDPVSQLIAEVEYARSVQEMRLRRSASTCMANQ